jgi:hypothetical protein
MLKLAAAIAAVAMLHSSALAAVNPSHENRVVGAARASLIIQ